MSHRIQIFVDAPPPLHDLVRDLQSLLEVEFEKDTEQLPARLEIWYRAHPQGIWLDAFEHSLEGDDDMPLEEYRYEIRLSGAIDYWVERERRLYEYAHLVFDTLKEQGKYRLMMTDDLQDKIAVFSPNEGSARSMA